MCICCISLIHSDISISEKYMYTCCVNGIIVERLYFPKPNLLTRSVYYNNNKLVFPCVYYLLRIYIFVIVLLLFFLCTIPSVSNYWYHPLRLQPLVHNTYYYDSNVGRHTTAIYVWLLCRLQQY